MKSGGGLFSIQLYFKSSTSIHFKVNFNVLNNGGGLVSPVLTWERQHGCQAALLKNINQNSEKKQFTNKQLWNKLFTDYKIKYFLTLVKMKDFK